MSNRQILVNKIRCPDGTILESRHRHDYVIHHDVADNKYMVDGGLDYLRRGGSGYTDLSFYYGDEHNLVREHFSWGSRGISGRDPLTYILLKDITESHLEALIEYTISSPVKEINMLFKDELVFRGDSS